MKKFSISLFAVCAIAIALFSAFKTNEVRRATGFYILTTPVIPSTFSSNWGTFQSGKYSHTSMYSNPATTGATPAELTTASCTVNIPDANDQVCAVQYTYSEGSNALQLDNGLSAGLVRDFPNSAPTTNIKYKAIP